jgi:3-oxoacyl-[acyl-carrier protein] reductase
MNSTALTIDLSGKVAVVTGGSGMLGRVMVRTLARCGAAVGVHYKKNKAKAESLVAEIDAAGGRAVAVQADITDEKSVLAMRDSVTEALGAPHIIVNNAVEQYKWTTVLEQGLADYEGQFRACVMQNVLMAKAFVPAMIERRFGRVVAISTDCAMECLPSQSAYTAGKRGMDAVLKVLAREVGEHGITVNEVAPGWTISDRDREKGTEVQPEYAKMIPLRRRGTDQEIANVVAFLASDLASFVTGAFVPVCGGKAMSAL